MANLSLRQAWIAAAILAALAAALLLNRLVVTDKARVENVIRSMAEAAGRADVNALFSHVAADYEDDAQGRLELEAWAAGLFTKFGPLRVTVQRLTVNVSGRLASAEVAISGRAENRDHGEPMDQSVWNVQLRKDPDQVWRVTRTTPLRLLGNEVSGWRELFGRF